METIPNVSYYIALLFRSMGNSGNVHLITKPS